MLSVESNGPAGNYGANKGLAKWYCLGSCIFKISNYKELQFNLETDKSLYVWQKLVLSLTEDSNDLPWMTVNPSYELSQCIMASQIKILSELLAKEMPSNFYTGYIYIVNIILFF